MSGEFHGFWVWVVPFQSGKGEVACSCSTARADESVARGGTGRTICRCRRVRRSLWPEGRSVISKRAGCGLMKISINE
jgi:hypothetical protein